MNKILNPPCCFCGYTGRDYWLRKTHASSCPWYDVGNEAKREAMMKNVVHAMFLKSLIVDIKSANELLRKAMEKDASGKKEQGKDKVRSNKSGH